MATQQPNSRHEVRRVMGPAHLARETGGRVRAGGEYRTRNRKRFMFFKVWLSEKND